MAAGTSGEAAAPGACPFPAEACTDDADVSSLTPSLGGDRDRRTCGRTGQAGCRLLRE